MPAHLSSLRGQMRLAAIYQFSRVSRFTTDWVLTTNHKRLAILYFMFILGSGLVGLTLATVVRLEFAYPGQFFIVHTPERYLTIASLHGIVMVFFVVIPLLFGAFANFLLPLQLGVRDVAFPRLNSFMFWLTPSGLVLLMHAIFSDRAHTTTGLVGYGDSRAILRRRFSEVSPEFARFHESSAPSTLAWRLVTITSGDISRPILLRSVAPSFATEPAALWVSRQDADTGHGQRPVAARLKGYSA